MEDDIESALEALTSRPDIGEALAPHRSALWYDHRGNYLEDMGRLWLLLRELSAGLDWDSVERGRIPLLSVHFGSIVDHQFTLEEVDEEMVWCAMVGAPDQETKERVLRVMRTSRIERVLRVDPNPPRPQQPSYSLVLYGLLMYETLIRMEAVPERGLRRYEGLIGLEVVHPRDELEVDLLRAFGAAIAMPSLLRVIGRNLRRWIREPQDTDALDARRIIDYARELRHIGAVKAAGVAAGTALELLLAQWSGMEPERVRAEKTMLGQLIREVEKQLGLPREAVDRLRVFNSVRARCAHALVENAAPDTELGQAVDGFLDWLVRAQRAGRPEV